MKVKKVLGNISWAVQELERFFKMNPDIKLIQVLQSIIISPKSSTSYEGIEVLYTLFYE